MKIVKLLVRVSKTARLTPVMCILTKRVIRCCFCEVMQQLQRAIGENLISISENIYKNLSTKIHTQIRQTFSEIYKNLQLNRCTFCEIFDYSRLLCQTKQISY